MKKLLAIALISMTCAGCSDPAIEYADGAKYWYVNGIEVTQEVESWLKLQQISLPLNESTRVLFILRFG